VNEHLTERRERANAGRGCPRVAQKVIKAAQFRFFVSTIERLMIFDSVFCLSQ
jgi:hypothetical protein